MQRLSLSLTAAALVTLGGLAACGQAAEPATRTLALTGSTAAVSFPSAPRLVRATRAGVVVREVPVAADGRFALSLPAATGYRVAVVGADGTTAELVFPRASGAIDATFDVTGAGSFDLGAVRYVGDPRQHSYRYAVPKSASPGAAAAAADGDGECEDGVDAATGAVCVDDDAPSSADTCAAEGDGEAADGGVDCQDGLDPAGQPCDGGPAANADDGAEDATAEAADGDGEQADDPAEAADGDGEQADDDGVDCQDGLDPAGQPCDGGPAANADDGTEEGAGELPAEAAVADHNLPAAIGCGEDEGGVDCQDGLDPSGQPCDGGPEANAND